MSRSQKTNAIAETLINGESSYQYSSFETRSTGGTSLIPRSQERKSFQVRNIHRLNSTSDDNILFWSGEKNIELLGRFHKSISFLHEVIYMYSINGFKLVEIF